MRRQRVSTLVYLTYWERIALEEIAESPAVDHRIRIRARILLLADRSDPPYATDGDVAEQTGVSRNTVANVRKRYATEGQNAALGQEGAQTLTPASVGRNIDQ